MNDKNERNLWTPEDLNARNSIMTTNIYKQSFVPTPVFNTPLLDQVFGESLSKDSCGLNRALEFVALPGTVFKVLEKTSHCNGRVYKVVTEEYSGLSELFIDTRFCFDPVSPTPRVKVCPSKETILKRMDRMTREKLPYVWGGNVSSGIEEMEKFYPIPEDISSEDRATWLMKGVDCSGMLYESTDGFTPRNTSQLTNFGNPVEVEKYYGALVMDKSDAHREKEIKDIISVLKPLDLIVWKGHVFMVYDSDTTVESRHGKGCHKMDIMDRFKELMGKGGRIPVDNYHRDGVEKGGSFVVRRWHPEMI